MRRLPSLALMAGCLVSLLSLPGLAAADGDTGTPTQPPQVAPSVTESNATTVDSVYLRSGGMFRGRVTEIVPGSHVTVKLENGESRNIVWADVDRVIVASANVPAPPTPGAPAAATAAPKAGPMARVHITGGNQATLFRQPAGTTDWVTACTAPCDQEMPLGDAYKIGGSGLKTTAEFHLEAGPGESVELSVDGPSWFGIIGGGLLTIAGGTTAYAGILVALGGAGCEYDCKGVETGGLVALGIGVGAMALGLAIVYPSLKTDIEQQRDRAGKAKDAFVRAPSWRSASATEQGAPTTFPLLFSRSF